MSNPSLEGATRTVGSRRRLVFLVVGMAVVGCSVVFVTTFVLYRAAFEGQRARLLETVRSRARLLESVANFDRQYSPDYPGGPTAATISQITAAHERFEGAGGTGELTLARQVGDSIVFLLTHGHSGVTTPTPIPVASDLAEPMRRALRGESGTIVGLDYHGDLVLAAYESTTGLGLGVVAKIDIAEIRAPFIRAAILAVLAGIVLIGLGAYLFRAIMEPLIGEVWASERKFRSLFERSLDAIAIVSNDGVLEDANDALSKLIGYSRNELQGKEVGAFYANLELRKSFIDAIDAAGSVRDFEARLRRKDGTEIDCLLTAVARIGPTSDHIGHVTIIRDMTERQRAEEAMRASEAEYRGLFENAPYGIYRSTTDGRFSAVNPALVRMLGYESAEELLQIDIAQDLYVESADRERFLRLQGGTSPGLMEEVLWRRKDGTQITVALKGRSLFGGDGTPMGLEAMAEDVTEQRTLESQLRQAQKMEAIGQLTGGIAHDFNNELLVILLNTQLLIESIERGETPRKDQLGDISEAARRASEITQQLVGFSRRAALKPAPTDLTSRVEKLAVMLARILPASIRVQTEADKSVSSVLVDPNSVEQMILNLTTNARRAMPDGGTMTLRVWEADLDQEYCDKYPPTEPGCYVLVSVTDTGIGMDKAVKARIFEPFFTTRPVGEGTGLGMAMVYGLTKQQHGYVHVDSELGKGTSVTLAFPVVSGVAATVSADLAVTTASGGQETILFVDDEQALRRVGKRVLESRGYTVVTACDGQDALKKLRANRSSFDLIITDLMMPNMDGADLCSKLESEGFALPVILASGYSDREVQGQMIAQQPVSFLRKPWAVTEMLNAVREALDD